MERKEFMEKVVRELEGRGLNPRFTEVIKNGVKFNAVTVGEGNIRPSIYLDSFYDNNLSVSETADKVVESAEKAELEKADMEHVDKLLTDVSYVKANVFVECSKANTYLGHVRKESDNITFTMVVRLNFASKIEGKVRVTPSYLESFDISEDELWSIAKANSEKDVYVQGLFEFINSTRGCFSTTDEDEDEFGVVITNKNKYFGAYAVFTDTAKTEIKKRLHTDKVFVIPSSIHETIVLPYKQIPIEVLMEMVREVNTSVVKDEEILSYTPLTLVI